MTEMQFNIGDSIKVSDFGIQGTIIEIKLLPYKRDSLYTQYLIEWFDGTDIKTNWFYEWQIEKAS